MAVTTQSARELAWDADINYVSAQEGRDLLDRQARKYLDMSGDEFVRKYRAGELEDPDRTDVLRVATLIPLAEQ